MQKTLARGTTAEVAFAYLRIRPPRRAVTDLALKGVGGPHRILLRGTDRRGFGNGGLAWSRDGIELGFIEHVGNVDGHRVRVLNVASGRARTVLRAPGSSLYAISWSPKGDRLALVRFYSPGFSIELLDLRTRARRRAR